MQDNWEIHWEDYYEILQVHPSAELEVIQAAYKKLAQKYHPDINKDPSAGERMKKINLAYDILKDPEKRKRYDAEWFKKVGTTGKSNLPKTKPVVNPEYIHFKDVEPGKTQTASFIVSNAGGPFTKLSVANPDSWVKVVRGFSLTDSSELPAQVDIEVEGYDWDKSYSEVIRVTLDDEEALVRVELQTKPEPVRGASTVRAGSRTKTGYHSPPPITSKKRVAIRHRNWDKWNKRLFGLIIISLMGWFIWNNVVWGKIIPSDEFSRASVWVDRNLPKEKRLADPYNPGNSFGLRSELLGRKTIGEKTWAVAYYGVNRQSHYPGRWIFPGTGYILYSSNKGKNWEIRKEVLNFLPFSFGAGWKEEIKIMAEKEIYIGGDTGVLYSNDGGYNWEIRKPPSEIEAMTKIDFTDAPHLRMRGYYLEYSESIKKQYGERLNDKKRYPLYFHEISIEYESFDGGKGWQFVKKLSH